MLIFLKNMIASSFNISFVLIFVFPFIYVFYLVMIIVFCFYCRLCGSHTRQSSATFLSSALQGGIRGQQGCRLCVFA